MDFLRKIYFPRENQLNSREREKNNFCLLRGDWHHQNVLGKMSKK